MSKGNRYWLIFIFVLLIVSIWAAVAPGSVLGRTGYKLGLDLKGGYLLGYSVVKADPSQSDADVMNAIKRTVEMRINKYGVAEPIVKTLHNENGNFIQVQLPEINDPEAALRLIGKTAVLDFRERVLDASGQPVLDGSGNPTWTIATGITSDGNEVELTGRYLKPNAHVEVQNNQPVVAFEWNSDGATVFEQVTRKNLNKPLGIFLDDELISNPTVNAVISDKGIIEGLTLDEAQNLVILLNSGSLPAELTLVQSRPLGATLGADALNKSIIAGIIGVALVILYMCFFYRVSGVVACLALLIFAALNMAIFRLIPVTLTLSGIAGFFVSLGMGVDGNVLVAERLKEELRAGHTIGSAVEGAFRESWTAIWDSNVTVFIACAVLYWLGSYLGEFTVVGFATTLFIGTALSMFTQVTVTRTLLRATVSAGLATSAGAYGVNK